MQNKAKASAAAKVKADEQAKRESYDAGRSRMKREKEEHAGRGPIPAPCRDFRLPQRQVPALLMIWELTQVCKNTCGWVGAGVGCAGQLCRFVVWPPPHGSDNRFDILMDLGVYLVFHTLQGNSRLLCTLSRAYQELQ